MNLDNQVIKIVQIYPVQFSCLTNQNQKLLFHFADREISTRCKHGEQ